MMPASFLSTLPFSNSLLGPQTGIPHQYSTHQMKASNPATGGCEPPCGCWELNLGPLEEQLVVFPAFVLSFETIFLCVVLAGLKTRLASNSGIRLPLPAQHWVEDMEQLSA